MKLLSDLRRTSAEFAKHEEALLRELRTKRSAVERRSQEQMEAIDTNIADRTSEITAAFEAGEEYIRSTYERRRMRVERTTQTLQRTLLRRTKDARSSYLGALQMRQHRLQQKLIADQQAAANSLTALSSFKARLATLDRKAASTLSSFGSLRRLVRRPASGT